MNNISKNMYLNFVRVSTQVGTYINFHFDNIIQDLHHITLRDFVTIRNLQILSAQLSYDDTTSDH